MDRRAFVTAVFSMLASPLAAEHIVLAEQASKRFAQALADVAEVLTPAQRKQIAERMESFGRRWRHG